MNVTESGESLNALLKLGSFYLNDKKGKDLSRAGHIYKFCIAKYTNDFRAYYNLGNVYVEQGMFDDAIQAYNQVLIYNPNLLEAYGSLSGLLIKQQKPIDATRICYHGLLIDPLDRTCSYNINIALRQIGWIKQAISYTWNALDTICKSNGKLTFTDYPCPTHTYNTNVIHNNSNDNDYNHYNRKKESESNSHLTFVCVKWGKKYGALYVNSLYRSIKQGWQSTQTQSKCQQHQQQPSFSFICYTEDTTNIDEEIECRSFPKQTTAAAGGSQWSGWWLKCSIFAKNNNDDDDNSDCNFNLAGWIIYLDLDTVITGNMNIFEWSNTSGDLDQETLYILSADGIVNERRQCGMNSSVMIWHNNNNNNSNNNNYNNNNNKMESMYTFLLDNYKEVNTCIYKFDHYLEMMLMSDLANSDGNSDKDSDMNNNITKRRVRVPICKYRYLEDIFPGRIKDFLSIENWDDYSITSINDNKSNNTMATSKSKTLKSLYEIDGITIICFPLTPKPLEVRHQYAWIDNYFNNDKDSVENKNIVRDLMKEEID